MTETKTDWRQDELLDHEYDGIREYDNPCPGWWSWLFFGTAVFAAVYYFYFQLGKAGITVEKAHSRAIATNLRLRFSEIGELTVDQATILEFMNRPEWLQVGESVYQQRCKSCHGEEGRGLVGPNMTDDHYKNVKQITDLARVVEEGAAAGSMPAWRNRLHQNEIVLVAAYTAVLRGRNLTGPRPAEGEVIDPWPTPGSQDAARRDAGAAGSGEPPAEKAKPETKQPAEGAKS